MNPFTTRWARAAGAIAWRSVHVMFSKPSLILPSLVFPLFFFAAFAGGLSAVSEAPDFGYPNYTTFQYIFVLMQSAVFGGVFTGFSIAADFEFGFARRMLLATRNRSALGHELAEFCQSQSVIRQPDGAPINDFARLRQILESGLDENLRKLGRMALLVG